MDKRVIIYFLILIIFESCQQNSNKSIKIKHYDCYNGITAINIDSLPLYKYFSDYGEFIDISDELKTNFNGKIELIREYNYKKSNRFDEDILTPTTEIISYFNDKNQLIKSVTKIISDKNEYVSAENQYSEENNLISEGRFEKDIKILNMYSYSEKGQLQYMKTKMDINNSNLSDRIMSNINWEYKNSYYYNKKGKLIKEVQSNIMNKDSCVVKYEYDLGLGEQFYQIIKYDKESGKRQFITRLSYDKDKNALTLISWSVFFSQSNDEINDNNLESKIIIFFNDNCKVSKVTKVEKWEKSTKKYSKYEFNLHGDLILKDILVYPDDNENDFNFDYKQKFEPNFILEPEYEVYKYSYDSNGNWIERTNGEDVVKRKIKYRINSKPNK